MTLISHAVKFLYTVHKIPKYQWVLTIALLAACIGIAKQYEVDFKTVYAVAIVENVQESYVQQPTYHAGRYFYGPFSLILIRPFGLFSYEVSRWIWIALQTFCFFVFFRFLYRFYPDLKKSFVFWILSFIFLINPVHGNFQSNNIQLMLMAALMFAESLSTQTKQHRFFAGFIVSLIASIKIFPAFIGLYYLITKKKEVSYGLFGGALFALAMPVFFYGWDTNVRFFHDFIANVSTYEADNELTRPDILSLASMVTTYTDGVVFVGKQYLASVLFIAISLLFFAIAYVLRKTDEVSTSVWALGMMLMAILTPSARVHFWVFCVPAFCEVASQFDRKSLFTRWEGYLLVLSLLMVSFTTESIIGKNLNDYCEYLRVPLVGLFLLSGLLLRRISRKTAYNATHQKQTAISAN